MAITINGGRTVTTSGDPVTVTVGATADVGDGKKHPNSIAIQFSGTECHVIQFFRREKVLDGTESTEIIGVDRGGHNTFRFSTEAAPEWLVDTTSAAVPYYDFGYAGEMTGTNYIMIDAPTITGGKFDLPHWLDFTGFYGVSYCLSDKKLIAIVYWTLLKMRYTQPSLTAQLIGGAGLWDWVCVSWGRSILSRQGYDASLYLPASSLK